VKSCSDLIFNLYKNKKFHKKNIFQSKLLKNVIKNMQLKRKEKEKKSKYKNNRKKCNSGCNCKEKIEKVVEIG
jgi:hypothetical protein